MDFCPEVKNTSSRRIHFLLIAWLVLYMASGLLTLRIYPPVNYNLGDEIWAFEGGRGFLRGEFPIDYTSPRLYFSIIAAFFVLAGETVFSARALSLIAATALLYMTYRAGREIADEKTGLASSLLLGSAFSFQWQGRIARPEMLTGLFLVTAFFLLVKAAKNSDGKRLFFGSLIASLSINIHPGNVQHMAGFLFVYLLVFRKRLPSWGSAFFAGGFFAGLLLWMLQTPLLWGVAAGGQPQALRGAYAFPFLKKGFLELIREAVFSFPSDIYSYMSMFDDFFPTNITIWFFAVFALSVWSFSVFGPHRGKVFMLIGFFASAWVSGYFLTERMGYWHMVEFYPFLAIAMAIGLMHPPRLGRPQTVKKAASLLLAVFVAAGMADTAISIYKVKDFSYGRLLKAVSDAVGPMPVGRGSRGGRGGAVIGMDLYRPAFREGEFENFWFSLDRPYEYCPDFEGEIRRLKVRYIIADDLFRHFSSASCGPDYEKEALRYLFSKTKLKASLQVKYPNYWVMDKVISEVYVFETH